MTDILCRWLNDELKISQKVDQASFARAFSSGYLIGEVLNKYQLQDDFEHFSQSRTADSKLHNFTRLEPVLHLLGIPFDVNMARDVMTENHGIATHLLYQLYIALNNKKKANLTGVAMETQRPAAPAKLNAIESGIYKERLKHITPRQTDLNLEEVASRFHEHQIKMEQTTFRDRFLESENRIRQQQEQRQLLLARSRLLHAKQSEMVAKIRAATVHIPKVPTKSTGTLQRTKELHQKRTAGETIEAIARFEDKLKMMLVPTDDGVGEIDVGYILKRDEDKGDSLSLIKVSSNDEYIGKIRKRLHEDAAAREEREKRRRKVMGEQMSAHQTQEEARREEMMVNRLMRQSQQERRIAVQLLQARHEKEIIRNNRILREQQYQERRLKDFEDALNREAELARLHREEYKEQIKLEQERHSTIAAQRAEERYRRHYDSCSEIVGQIVDFACKVAEYRQLTENLLPTKLMRDWKMLFVSGCLLFETVARDSGDPTPEQILEEERQMLLDEGDFIEYKNMVCEWQPLETMEITAPPNPNPVVGHIIHRLYKIVHPPTPPPPPPVFPPFPIRACVLGKAFAGKSPVIKKLAQEHRLVVLCTEQLIREAVEAHKNNEIMEVELELDVPEINAAAPVPGADSMAVTNSEAAPAESADTLQGIDIRTTDSTWKDSNFSQMKHQESKESAISKIGSIQRSKDKIKVSKVPQPSERNRLGVKALKYLQKGRAVDDQIVVEILTNAIKRIPESTGWVIDGYPHNYNQAKHLERALSGFEANAKDNPKQVAKTKAHKSSLVPDPRPQPPPLEPMSGIDVVILFDIDDDLCIKRANGRTFQVQSDTEFHEEFNPPPEGTATGVNKQEKVIPVTDPSNTQEQIQQRISAFRDSWPKLEKWFTRFGTLKKVDASGKQEEVYLETEKILEDILAKLLGGKEDSSVPLEATEVKTELPPEVAPGAPPEIVPDAPKEEPAPGGPESKLSRPSSKSGSRSGSATKRTTSPASSKEGKKDGKRDKSSSPKRVESSVKSDKKASRGSSPKSQKGGKKKGKTPEPEPEPEPEEPTGPPPPQPGDEDWQFVDLEVENALAEVLVDQWDGVEEHYVANCKYVFRQVRKERENIYRYFYQIKKDFLVYLHRPDHKQEFVTQWQKDYNSVSDDMREDEETRAELHQRLDDLREKLWNICDERKEQAEKERKSIMTEGWLEDRLGVLSNHYITQMQAEVDRFQDTVRLLKDYYKSMDGQIPDELNVNYERIPLVELPAERPESPETPRSDSGVITPTSDEGLGGPRSDRSKSPRTKDRSKSPKERIKSPKANEKPTPGTKSRSPTPKKKISTSKEKDLAGDQPPTPPGGVGLRIKIPLVPRRAASPDADSKPGTTAGKDKKDKKGTKKDDVPGTDSPMPPTDPDEKLVFDAHCFAVNAVGGIMGIEMAAKEAEEEAEQQRQLEKEQDRIRAAKGLKPLGKSKGGGKKSRSPSPKKGGKGKEADLQGAASPSSSEEMSEEDKQKKLTRERMRQEYYFAIKEEDVACKVRLDLIKSVGTAVLLDLKMKADAAHKDMNDWLGARFLKEMESIDTMSEVIRNAIETRQKLKDQVILQQEDFLVDADHQMLKSPSPPPTPVLVERVMPDHFTVHQLFGLYKQFSAIALLGIMSSKSFIETMDNIVSVTHGMEQLPDLWMHMTSGQVHEISSALATDTDYVDWRRLLLALLWPIPTPTQAQLLETLQHFKDMDQKNTGYVTREQYDRMNLWFDTGSASPDSYDRVSNLKKILFDVFIDGAHPSQRLEYLSMLLYFSAAPNSYEGFLRALSVASNCHMPRLQKPLQQFQPSVTCTQPERAVSVADSIIPESDEDQQDKAPVEPPMTVEEIPPEAIDAMVPLQALFRVLHHSEISGGDSHRFSITVDPEDNASMEKLSAVYAELGDETLKPVQFRVLIEHPVVQDVILSCKTFRALDLRGILSISAEHEVHSIKTMD